LNELVIGSAKGQKIDLKKSMEQIFRGKGTSVIHFPKLKVPQMIVFKTDKDCKNLLKH